MADLVQSAKDIIKNNLYLTLATAEGNSPWVAPLYFCVDSSYNFYFVSEIDTKHARDIQINPEVAFAIFDSHSEVGKGSGIQGSGNVQIVKDEEVASELANYHTDFIKLTPEMLKGSAPYRLFKLVPDKIFVLDSEAKPSKRVEVTLK